MGTRTGARLAHTVAPTIVLLLALAGCSVAATSDAAPAANAGEAADSSSDAKIVEATETAAPGTCGARHVNPSDPIPGDLFAQCVVDATIEVGTAEMSSTVGDITTAGPVTFRPPISAHISSQPSGLQAIIIGERGWLLGPGRSDWVAGDPNGDPTERMAHSTVMTYAATANPDATRTLLASAESWKPTVSDTIDGTVVQGYAGTPVQEGVTYDNFTVWITHDDLPLRIEQSGVGYGGYPFSGVMDFTDYGEPVQISAPGS